jgi:hypothetical protein
MIVRYAVKCETCGQPHTVRVGMGHDETQTHKFPCRECSEEIVLRMDLDHAQHSWEVKCVENCSATDEVADAPIVNVDAIFVIPRELQGLDRIIPRLAYSHDMSLCCTDQQPGEVSSRLDIYVRRTYSGRPSFSMRFSEATAMATSVVCRPSVRERSASPITRL